LRGSEGVPDVARVDHERGVVHDVAARVQRVPPLAADEPAEGGEDEADDDEADPEPREDPLGAAPQVVPEAVAQPTAGDEEAGQREKAVDAVVADPRE